MKIRYDPDADAIYIGLLDEVVDHTREVDANTLLDFNKKGMVIGIELLFVKEKNPKILEEFQVEGIIS
ncbi:DUF2283 domain-containing protein [Candidatus Woesearchaeota archaeon]|nr:DUF2283 domain-containing protein [Candidatus Woesearchaeota archaeon]